MPIEILVAIIGGVTGLAGMVVAIWQAATAGRAERSSSAAAITTAASELVDDLHNELQRLKQRVSDLERLSAEQATRIARLQSELDAAERRIRALERENTCLREENDRLAQIAAGQDIRVVVGHNPPIGGDRTPSLPSSPSEHDEQGSI